MDDVKPLIFQKNDKAVLFVKLYGHQKESDVEGRLSSFLPEIQWLVVNGELSKVAWVNDD